MLLPATTEIQVLRPIALKLANLCDLDLGLGSQGTAGDNVAWCGKWPSASRTAF